MSQPELGAPPAKAQSFRRRAGVSAESVAPIAINDLNSLQTPVYQKTDEEKIKIKSILSTNYFFSSMSSDILEKVINALAPHTFKKGHNIINQGEEGNDYYILIDGVCHTYKTFDDKSTKMVKVYNAGDAFGELALLYTAPRAATVQVESEVAHCLALDRNTFQVTIRLAVEKKRQQYKEFLDKNPLLSVLDNYQKEVIADCLRDYEFAPGHKIITAGDTTDKRFFFLLSGSAIATKRLTPYDENESTVMRYSAGDYFGELALISDNPRAANVIATSQTLCAGLDRDAFERLLGPCTQTLDTAIKKYKQGEDKALAQQALTQQMSKMSLNHVETHESKPSVTDEQTQQ